MKKNSKSGNRPLNIEMQCHQCFPNPRDRDWVKHITIMFLQFRLQWEPPASYTMVYSWDCTIYLVCLSQNTNFLVIREVLLSEALSRDMPLVSLAPRRIARTHDDHDGALTFRENSGSNQLTRTWRSASTQGKFPASSGLIPLTTLWPKWEPVRTPLMN